MAATFSIKFYPKNKAIPAHYYAEWNDDDSGTIGASASIGTAIGEDGQLNMSKIRHHALIIKAMIEALVDHADPPKPNFDTQGEQSILKNQQKLNVRIAF